MKRTIVELNVNIPMGEKNFGVGQKISTQHGIWKTVTAIKDKSLEWESEIDFIYEVYVEGQHYMDIINTPVTVVYELEESE